MCCPGLLDLAIFPSRQSKYQMKWIDFCHERQNFLGNLRIGDSLGRIWTDIPQVSIQHWLASMTQRCWACIQAHGVYVIKSWNPGSSVNPHSTVFMLDKSVSRTKSEARHSNCYCWVYITRLRQLSVFVQWWVMGKECQYWITCLISAFTEAFFWVTCQTVQEMEATQIHEINILGSVNFHLLHLFHIRRLKYA